MMDNGIKIMSLQGAEILKNNLDGIKIDREYNAVFSYSLLLDKLTTMGLKVNKDTTKDIIALNFDYGYTPKDAISKRSKIKSNKEEIEKAIEDKKKALEERKLRSTNKDKRPFTDQINSLSNKVRVLKKENKKLQQEIDSMKMSNEDVRYKIYGDGFYLEFYKKNRNTKKYEVDKRIDYKFWFRTPSKSRTGQVYAINAELLDNIRAWQTMELQLPDTDAKLVEFEAYLSLTASSIVGKVSIDPRTEILVVNDLDSYKEVECARVYTDAKGECQVENKEMKVKNTLWDGMCLLDDSAFQGEYENNSFMLLRQHFFKACAFRTFISKFFMDYCNEHGLDYNTYTVKDRYGRELLVKNLRCITTENAIKWEKFTNIGASYDYWCDKVAEDNNMFGICKVDHASKYGKYQRMSYQMINSLLLNPSQSIELCSDTVEYVNSLKDDDDLYIDFLERTKSSVNANSLMIDLYKRNPEFADSQIFRKFKSKSVNEYKDTLRAGKLLVEGDNLTVVGNPYILLLHSVGEVPYNIVENKYIIEENYRDITLPDIEQGYSVYAPRFDDKEEIAMFRNPHNAPNNILYGTNTKHDLMVKYFSFGKNIIAINMINTDVQDRANGMDMDSDFCMCTNNKVIVDAAVRALEYPTIVNDIGLDDDRKYNNTMHDLAYIDNLLAESKYCIGQSSNIAQLGLSWYCKNQKKELKDLKDIVCIMSVLAQCSIDNSKRQYKVDLNSEIARITKEECMDVKKGKYKAKPYFWQYIKDVKEKKAKQENIYAIANKEDKQEAIEKNIIAKAEKKKEKNDKIKDIEKHCLKEKICTMDYIQAGIDDIKNNMTNKKKTDDVNFIKNMSGKADYTQVKRVKDIIKELDDMVKAHHDNKEENDEVWEVRHQIKMDEVVERVSKIKLSKKSMQVIVRDAFTENKYYQRKILNCLYKAHKDTFLELFKDF